MTLHKLLLFSILLEMQITTAMGSQTPPPYNPPLETPHAPKKTPQILAPHASATQKSLPFTFNPEDLRRARISYLLKEFERKKDTLVFKKKKPDNSDRLNILTDEQKEEILKHLLEQKAHPKIKKSH